MVVVVVVGEQTQTVSEVDVHEQDRPGLAQVVAKTDPVVAHEWVVPQPDGSLAVVVSPDALAVDLRVELDHVSNSHSPRIASEGGEETSKTSAKQLYEAFWSRLALSDWIELVDGEVEQVSQEREGHEVSGDDWESSFVQVVDALFSWDSQQSVEWRGVTLLEMSWEGSVTVVASLR